MNKNKKYIVLPDKSQSLSMSNYTVEFGYSHRNQKRSHRMASNSSEAEMGSMRKIGDKKMEEEFILNKVNKN